MVRGPKVDSLTCRHEFESEKKGCDNRYTRRVGGDCEASNPGRDSP